MAAATLREVIEAYMTGPSERPAATMVPHLSELDQQALVTILHSPLAPWSAEAVRRARGGYDWYLPAQRACQALGTDLSRAKFARKPVLDRIDEVCGDLEPPAIDLLMDVGAPTRRIALYRTRAYADLVRHTVQRMPIADVYTLFYTRFSPRWNLKAADWVEHAVSGSGQGPKACGLAMFAVHYHVLQERIAEHERVNPAGHREALEQAKARAKDEVARLRGDLAPPRPRFMD